MDNKSEELKKYREDMIKDLLKVFNKYPLINTDPLKKELENILKFIQYTEYINIKKNL